MTEEGKHKVCIHCRRPEGIGPVGVVEGNLEVGVVYCCKDCLVRTQGLKLDIFLYNPDGERLQQTLH